VHRLGGVFGGLGDHHQVQASIIQGCNQAPQPGSSELRAGLGSGPELIAMVTVSWLTSIPAFFMSWFSKWHELD